VWGRPGRFATGEEGGGWATPGDQGRVGDWRRAAVGMGWTVAATDSDDELWTLRMGSCRARMSYGGVWT
jgi:hypothetical protein